MPREGLSWAQFGQPQVSESTAATVWPFAGDQTSKAFTHANQITDTKKPCCWKPVCFSWPAVAASDGRVRSCDSGPVRVGLDVAAVVAGKHRAGAPSESRSECTSTVTMCLVSLHHDPSLSGGYVQLVQ